VRFDQLVPLVELSPDLKKGSVRVRAFVEGLGREPLKGELCVEIPDAGAKVLHEIEIKPGTQVCEARVELPAPKLWWPIGHGPQNM